MAIKGKADEKAEVPPAKKAKTEETPAPAEEEAAEEPPKELEEDAPAEKGPKIKEKVGFLVKDTTLNVAVSDFGNMLTCFSDSGFQYLLAGARANVGIKSGRYMFEVNVVELMHQKQDTTGVTGRVPQPRNFFRLGLSTENSSLLIGEDEQSVCFDAEGSFIHNKKKTNVGAKFERSMNVCVLVNLDAGSENAYTVSLFRDGERICQPQKLPEGLMGKALFPTVTYRNVTVHYNFGPLAHADLPFKCRMIQDATAKDAIVAKDEAPKDGKYTAVFPTSLPDEGTFQWLDSWLEENPGYTELSDRAILDWAQKSGIARLKPYNSMVCKDKPEMSFGLPYMDEKTVQKMIKILAGLQKRNFVVMEVQANLLKDERAKLLESFTDFKKVALVVAGEPPKAFKQKSQDLALSEKQEKSDADFKKKLEEEKKKKAFAKKVKEDAKKKKKEEKAQKKANEERKKKLADILAKREADKKAAAEGKKAEEDVKMEETKEEEKEEVKEEAKEEESEESEAEPMEVEEKDPEPPKVELTDEEKKVWFKPSHIPDLTPAALNAGFSKFTFPAKTEGFDEVKFLWQPQPKAEEHLASWKQEKKLTARVEDLVVGEWFETRQKEWSKFLQSCKQKQNDYKAAVAKKVAEKASKQKLREQRIAQAKAKAAAKKAQKEAVAKAAKEKAEKAAAEKKAKKEAKAKAKAEKEAKGEAIDLDEEEEEEKEEEPKPIELDEEESEKEEEEPEEPEEEEEVVDIETLEVFGIEDIFEVGGKPINQPLFSQFGFEDWALLTLRFELNLLIHSFKKDVKDPERKEIHEDNIGFYYQKYFKKGLNPAFFGVKGLKELLKFFDDTIKVSDKKVLETFLPGDSETFNVFILLAEEARRDRSRRIDMGQEEAKINMQTGSLSGMVALSGAGSGNLSALSQLALQRAAQNTAAANAAKANPAKPGMPLTPASVSVARPPGLVGAAGPGMIRPAANAWAATQQTPWGAAQRPAAPGMAWGAQPRPAFPRPVASGLLRPTIRPQGW